MKSGRAKHPDGKFSETTLEANHDFEGGREKFASKASKKKIWYVPVLTSATGHEHRS